MHRRIPSPFSLYIRSMFFRGFISAFLLVLFFGNAKAQSPIALFDSLSETIKHSTYFDSAAVFKNGKKAIQLARELKDLSREAKIYQYYGSYNYHSGKLERARKYYDSSIVLAAKAQDTTLLIASKIRIAFIISTMDSYEAEKEFNKLFEQSTSHRNRLECLNGLALIYENRGENAEALDYYLKALNEAEEIDDTYFKGILLNNIGLIKLKNEQYDEALADFQQALIYAKEVNEIRLSYNLQNNIGLIFYTKEDYVAAADHYRETIQHAQEIGFPYAVAVAHINLSNSYNYIDEHNKALLHADSAVRYMKAANDFSNLSLVQFLKASAKRSLNRYQEALVDVLAGVEHAKENQDLNSISRGYKLKSDIHEDLGDFKNAFLALKEHYLYKDSLDEISNKARIDELQIAYKTEKKERELEEERTRSQLLANEKQLIEQEKQLTESRIVLVAIIGIALIIGIIIVFYLNSLRLSKQQQKKFSQNLIENLDEERRRISADLHDGIGQSLSFIKTQFQRHKRGDNIDLDDIIKNTSEIIEQTRTISHRLHPSSLEKIGLKRAIESLLEKVEAQNSIVTSYELDEGIEGLRPEQKTQLYRITQECINNSLKHANARAIRVMIEKTEDGFKYSYQDNGVGMDLNAKKTMGLGLMTMQERAHKINAKLSYITQPGKGFKLIMRI